MKDGIKGMLERLTEEQLEQAFKNIGVDVSCGVCMEIFFTGGKWPWSNHTCEKQRQETHDCLLVVVDGKIHC